MASATRRALESLGVLLVLASLKGRSPNGQFYREKIEDIEDIGVGTHFHF